LPWSLFWTGIILPFGAPTNRGEAQNACYALLAKFVVKLNAFAEAVRKDINPMYRRREGKFLIYDDMGTRNGMEPMIVEPHLKGAEELVAKYVPAVKKRLLD
jgi:hypothetical protein